jgi:uncharacterized BrkB/YihY/UPF0761 family membrane protein
MTLKNCWEAVRATLRLLGRHRSIGIAAEMSFWLFCSLIPLSFIAVIILAHLPEKGTRLLEAIFAEAPDATRALVGEEVAALSHPARGSRGS